MSRRNRDQPLDYKVVLGQATGSKHSKLGMPSQDCAAIHRTSSLHGLVLVMGDGLGSCARGGEAARILTDTIGLLAAKFLEDHSSQEVPKDEVEWWIALAKEAMEDEALSTQNQPEAYATTFLLVLIDHEGVFYAQIGDGLIAVEKSDPRHEWDHIFWPIEGEFANETDCVSPGRQIQNLRTERREIRPRELALCTDGIQPMALHFASKSVHAPFFNALLAPVRACQDYLTAEALNEPLSAMLEREEFARASDDDKTLILATRRSELRLDVFA